MLRAEVLEIQRLAWEEGLAPLEIAPRVARAVDTVRRALRLDAASVPEKRVPGCMPKRAVLESARVRAERSKLRARLADGELTLADVLAAPVHPLVENLPLVEVARMRRRAQRGRHATASLEMMGREAVRDRVNLMTAAGNASAFSRAWVAEHGEKWMMQQPERSSV